MLALTERQQKFVVAVAESGTDNYTRCAREAGYSTDSEGALRVAAHRLIHDSKIQEAFQEYTAAALKGGAPLALRAVIEIASDPQHKDRLRAAQTILDRTGHHATSEHTVKVQDVSRTDEAMIERIKQLGKELNLAPAEVQKMIANTGITIDAEFSEVEEWENA